MSNTISQAATGQAADAASGLSAKGLSAALGGGGTLVLGGLTANDLAVVLGAIVAVVGLGVQWYYRHQEFKLRQREHDARMSTLKQGGE